jgi:hypothetical protein
MLGKRQAGSSKGCPDDDRDHNFKQDASGCEGQGHTNFEPVRLAASWIDQPQASCRPNYILFSQWHLEKKQREEPGQDKQGQDEPGAHEGGEPSEVNPGQSWCLPGGRNQDRLQIRLPPRDPLTPYLIDAYIILELQGQLLQETFLMQEIDLYWDKQLRMPVRKVGDIEITSSRDGVGYKEVHCYRAKLATLSSNNLAFLIGPLPPYLLLQRADARVTLSCQLPWA